MGLANASVPSPCISPVDSGPTIGVVTASSTEAAFVKADYSPSAWSDEGDAFAIPA